MNLQFHNEEHQMTGFLNSGNYKYHFNGMLYEEHPAHSLRDELGTVYNVLGEKIPCSKKFQKFYNYLFIDPTIDNSFVINGMTIKGECFYVGKGKANRFLHHFIPQFLKTKWPRVKRFWKIYENNSKPSVLFLNVGKSENEVIAEELKLINLFGRMDKNKGPLLNETDGGEGCSGTVFTQEHKDKLSASIKRKFAGRLMETSKEVYQYELSGNFIRKFSSITEATKKVAPYLKSPCSGTIVSALKGKTRTAHNYQWFYDYQGPEVVSETKNSRDKIIGKKYPHQYKKMGMYSKDTNELIKEFESIDKASLYSGTHRNVITKYAKNNLQEIKKNYYWKYIQK